MKKVGLLFLLMTLSQVVQAQNFNLQEAQRAFKQKRYSLVISLMERSLQQDSLQMRAYQLLGSSYLATKQPILAEKIAKDGLHYFPGSYALQWMEAEAIFQQGLLDKALQKYVRLSKSNPNKFKNKIDLRLGIIFREKGGQYYWQKKFDLAVQYFKKAKTQMPDSLSSYSNLAVAYMQQKEWRGALEITNEGLELFPLDSALMRMKATALYNIKDYKGVISEYKKLYEENPDDLDIALAYSQMLLAKGEAKKGSQIYTKLLKDHPHEKKIYRSLVDFYDRRRNNKAKRSALQKMRKEFPNDAEILKDIAKTYREEEKWDLARAVYDTLRMEHGNSRSVDMFLAQTFSKQDSLEKAIHLYDQLLKKYSNDAEILRLKGGLQGTLHRWGGAEKTYSRLVALSDSSSDFTLLGDAQIHLGDYGQAIANFEKAIEKSSSNPHVYLETAKFYYRKGNEEKAFDRGKEALKLALSNLRGLQKGLKDKLNGDEKLIALQSAGLGAKDLEQNNKFAFDSFHFIVESFPKDRVIPLLQSLKQK
ncbi:MAG: tetratricopeptide repeat protein, partial [Balneolaceae bacterium]